MDGVRLGIDFGTANTVGVIALPGREPRTLLFNGTPLLPSAIHAEPSGRLLIGRDAQHTAVVDPGAYEPHPKRCIDEGTVLLGAAETPVTALIAAVLNRVAAEAARVAGETPVETVITCPAAWGAERRETLRQAAEGLPNVRLVTEPVAAATYYVDVAGQRVPEGRPVLVYDFGAGTFDTTLMRRSGDTFDVLATEGLADCGGLDIDAAVVEYLGTIFAPRDAALWQRLVAPVETADRRAARQLWEGVREAKEMLSEHPTALIHVPLFDADAPLGREQLEQLAEPILARTVAACREVLRVAGEADPAAIFLTGGMSRMPAVGTALHRAFGLAPTSVDQPELAVAEGSVRTAADPAPLEEAPSWPPLEFTSAAPSQKRRTLLVAGAAAASVAVVVAAGFALADRGPSDPKALAAAVSQSPSHSPSAAPSPPPGVDPCLVGRWQQILEQKDNTIGGAKVKFNGGAKDVRTFSADGKFTENFNAREPSRVVYQGVTWEDWERGVATGTYQARNGVLLYSNTAATGSSWLTRNGRKQTVAALSFSTEPEQYICTGSSLTISASFYTSSWTKVG